MPKVQDYPDKLKPYVSLGVRPKVTGKNALADCPFCGREGKFSILVDTGQWRCFVCDAGDPGPKGSRGGNVYTFVRLLHATSLEAQKEGRHDNLARQRGYLAGRVLEEWGLTNSLITDEWLVPGYGAGGEINTLYRYTLDYQTKKMRLYATAELGHHLFGVNLYDPDKSTVYLCEGAWDGIALYEMLRTSKKDVEGYTMTGAVPSSLYARANVLATPGCTTFKEEWLPLFAGKRVVLCFDNDHPREHPHTKEIIAPAALEGARRVANLLASSAEHKPQSIHCLQWGPNGYDPDLPSGHDLRDVLSAEPEPKARVKRLWWLLEKVKPIPAEWIGGRTEEAKATGGTTLTLLPCQTYAAVVEAAQVPLEFHEGLDRALSIMLSIIVSTEAGGDQLWGTFIGPPACGKSTLCEAISTAVRWVTAKSTIRGFHSGYKSDASGKEDNSLIPLVSNKTLVTKDGDTLMQSPNLAQILSEARDLYDRTSRTHYRHGLARDYQGVNVTWILCGTGALVDIDTSELGQRFIKIIIMSEIDPTQEWRILLRKAKQADRSMNHKSDGKPENVQDPAMTRFYQLAGGYVEYLRANADDLLKQIELNDAVYEECAKLALFTAYLRARPSKRQKENAEREFATRLTSQFTRLAKCLCVVMNEPDATDEIMRRVKQTALDTSQGRVFRIAHALYRAGPRGCDPRALAYQLGELELELKELLGFMKKIGAADLFRLKVGPRIEGEPRWRLSPALTALFSELIGPTEEEQRAAAQEDADE